jgi:hypothetical protein
VNEAAKKLPDEPATGIPSSLRAAVRAEAAAREAREDLDDIADADAAWAERGHAIPLEELEAEFGTT